MPRHRRPAPVDGCRDVWVEHVGLETRARALTRGLAAAAALGRQALRSRVVFGVVVAADINLIAGLVR